MWEVIIHHPPEFWAEIPLQVRPYYRWYNIPASTTQTTDNPLQLIKKMVKVEDFVLLKIDIDNSPVEAEFIKQILEDPDVIRLIDDFYFEHHVYVPEMADPWSIKADHPFTLNSTYELFRKMRKAGIVAHSWV